MIGIGHGKYAKKNLVGGYYMQVKDEHEFMVKTYSDDHTYAMVYHNKRPNSKYLAFRYLSHGRLSLIYL